MDRRAAWILGFIFGGLFLCLFGFLFILSMAVRSGGGDTDVISGDDIVGVVEVIGPIQDSKDIVEKIRKFRDADAVKAIVLRVDSPGGAVGPSQEIYDAILDARKKKKVVASMGSTAASGGYYIAAAADQIYANPGTLTGSIGVIFQIPNVEGLFRWAGVQMNTVTAGGMKDIGSPFKTMSPEDRAYLESVLQNVHVQFIQAVAEGRNLEVEAVRPYADGRIFTGEQAKSYKLVDELGGLQDAALAAAKLAGIEGEPTLRYPEKDKPLLRELLGEDLQGAAAGVISGAVKQGVNELGGGFGLQYRMPGLAQ